MVLPVYEAGSGQKKVTFENEAWLYIYPTPRSAKSIEKCPHSHSSNSHDRDHHCFLLDPYSSSLHQNWYQCTCLITHTHIYIYCICKYVNIHIYIYTYTCVCVSKLWYHCVYITMCMCIVCAVYHALRPDIVPQSTSPPSFSRCWSASRTFP